MKLDHEQYEILMTALQNYRGELYIDGSNSQVLDKVNKLAQDMENEKESKEIKQERIPVTEEMINGDTSTTMAQASDWHAGDLSIGLGSETGIELEEHYNQGKVLCENCDE
tara:strand:- start:14479 stop:14811 length:333 start_codon:yes stop_codon:yes gene_type:complete